MQADDTLERGYIAAAQQREALVARIIALETALRELVEALDADSETRRVLSADAGYVAYRLTVALAAAREVLQ